MSTIIGTIKAVMGQVWIVASDGSRRLATEGEQIMRGELVVTDQGAATVTLPNGKNMDLGRGSEWGDGAVAASASGGADEQAIAAAQQAIAEGADPTHILEATAAGNSTIIDSFAEPTGAHNGHSHVILDLTGEILAPTAGYPTQGLDAATIAPVEEVTLLRPELDNSSDDPITPPPPQPLPEASITIDVIAGDNVINMNEAAQEKTVISGTTGLDVHPGDIVTVTVNGNSYQTQVAADGRWSVEANTHDLVASGEVHASVTTFDQYGNQASASAESAVALDITAPNVSLHIDVISGDGFINTAEAAKPITTISGTVGGDAKAGDVVHLEVNGTDYIAQVVAGEGGKLVWQTEVATSDLLAEPQVNGSITIRDAAGNETTAVDSESVVIDTTAPAVTLHIDVINDGYINANESKESTTTVKGIVGGDAKAGDIVHLEVNGTNYTATVVAGEGSALVWQTEVATSDLLADPIVNGSITIKDAAGNEATAIDDESVVIDTTAPVVTLHIDVISGDGYINAVESKEPTTTVKGTVGGDAKAGDVVHLEVNGTDYSAQVVAGDNGTLIWQTEVATSDLLADPEVNGSITIKDAAGNEATAIDDESVEIDTTAPVVTLHIDVISDGYINAAESKEPTTIVKGTVGGDAKAGDVVHLEVNGADYTAQVVAGENGTLVWQTEVATSDLLADPEVNGSITIKDAAGNEATAIDDESVIVDTTAPVVTLDIDVISGGYINAAELQEPTTTISGTVGGDAKAGDVVHLEVNGNEYTAEVYADKDGKLVWQTEVATSDLLADPEVNGSITIKDAAGNEATDIDDESVIIDTTAPVVTLDIDVISGGYINAAESQEPTTTISGTVGGDAKAGDVVHLEVNGNEYTAEVYADKDGKLVWQTEVATSDLLADPEVNGSITIKDAAGNEATDIDDESVIIDTTPPVVELEIDTISGDGFINAAESKEPTTTVKGTVGGDAKAGDVVHLEVNGNEYTAEVYTDKDGKLVWQTEVATSDLLADPEVNGSITIKDAAGNEATDIDDESVIVDTTAPVVTLHIDVISDGYINAAEAEKPTTNISGTVGGDAKAGDVVHLEINGKDYPATVVAGEDGALVWQTTVATSDLLADPIVNGTITIKDAAGNEATAIDDETVVIDTTAPVVTLHIDVISDGYINAAESKEPTTTVKGTVGGDAKAGDVVHLEVNDKTYTAEVYADKDGKLVWQTEVATSDLLADPEVNGSITIKDAAGNEATDIDDESVIIDTTAPVVTLDIDVISDGYINAAESKEPTTTVKGTVGGDAKAGDVVQLEVNGNKYTAEVVADKDGRLVWQTEVATSDLIADKQVNDSITITDEAGNKATAIDKETVIIDTEITVKVIIDPVTGDDFLSFAETNQLPGKSEPLIKVTGTVTGEAEAGDIVDVKVGDVTQKVTLTDDGKGNLVWEAEFKASNMMNNPKVSASISISDPAGNTASDSTSRPVTIETGNLITGDEKDNVINGGDTSDIIIADTQGFQQLPGQDYNIAFVVDSSGSVGATDIKSIIASLTTVFNALHQNAQLVNSGDVKILLVDFDAQVNFAVSVNLKDSGALKTLTDALAKMTSGGGTNYEDAFKTTSNWFHDVSSSSSENLTYFITDGKPTYYQSGEKTSVDVDGRSGNNNVVMLDVTKLDYHPGQVVSMNINGTSRVVIDASGNVYSWNGSTRTSVGIMRADGKGGYEISVRAGSGSSTTTDTTTNSTYAFGLLMAMCGNVEAIGINNGIKASDLIAYDSDGKVTAGISASELANAILGGDYVQMAGAQDTVHGNKGNDVIFGDMLQFGDKTGYAAIQEYVAGKLNIAVNQLEVSHIAQYISEHPAEFDQSQADGGRDVLFGGVGNDILYGGGGDDILVGGSGDDVLFGGKGDDILIGDGFDSMADIASHLNTPVNQLTFDKVVDYVTQHSEELGAIGSGNDKLYGGEGNDLLMGGGGNDILNGGEGNDLLLGGTGNDVLIGGKGNDTLYGGTGSDTFTWLKGDDGHDVIKDFRADEGDRIDLSDLLGDVANTDLASYIKVTDDNHGNTVIEINTNGQMQSGSSTMSITVENCTSADIDINSLIAKPDAPVI